MFRRDGSSINSHSVARESSAMAIAAAMARRTLLLAPRLVRLRSSVAPLHSMAHLQPSRPDWKHPPVSRSQSGSTHSGTASPAGVSPQLRSMSASFVSNLPPVKDTRIAKALSGLLGHGWLKLEPQVKSAVESAISGGSDDPAGKETLLDAWQAAQAVETFGGILTDMLMEINDLCGDSGENVGNIPHSTYQAVEAAHQKYMKYLSAFGEDEVYLRKKVELELGGVLLQIKQRLTGMDPKWSEISVLGTSGLAGSYIEKRRLPD